MTLLTAEASRTGEPDSSLPACGSASRKDPRGIESRGISRDSIERDSIRDPERFSGYRDGLYRQISVMPLVLGIFMLIKAASLLVLSSPFNQ